MIIYLEDIITEADMTEAVAELENDVIEAQCSSRGRFAKVNKAKESVNILTMKCCTQKWKLCQKKLKLMLKALEVAEAECKDNTSGLNPYRSRF